MGFNGSGVFSSTTAGIPVVTGTTISSTVQNTWQTELDTGLTDCVTKDGQSTTSARIPFALGLNVGNGTVAAPAINFTNDTGCGLYRIGSADIGFAIAGTKVWDIVAGSLTLSQDLLFTDATYDIGKTGATRPRDLFMSRNLTVGGTAAITGHVTVEGVTSTGATGTGKFVFDTAPTLGVVQATRLGLGVAADGAALALFNIAQGQIIKTSGATTGYQYGELTNTGAVLRFGIETSTGSALFTNSLAYSSVIGTTNATAFHLATNGAVRQTIAADGSSIQFGVTTIGGVYFSDTNTINGQYSSNANDVLHLNYRGYQGGSTQFRDLNIANGKTATIAFFQGSTGSVMFNAASPIGAGRVEIKQSSDAGGQGFALIASGSTNNTQLWQNGTTFNMGHSGAGDITINNSGSVTFGTVGPHAIGGSTISTAQLALKGTLSGFTDGLTIQSNIQPTADNPASLLSIAGTLTEAGSGTHPTLVALSIGFAITNGAATTTDAIGIDVATFAAGTGTTNAIGIRVAAPTGASNNYAINITSGVMNIASGGSTTISTGVGVIHMSTANPATCAAWIPISYAGTTYYLPGWTTNAP